MKKVIIKTKELSRLEKDKFKAEKKTLAGKHLSRKDKMALEGLSFFTFCWDYELFQQYNKTLEGVKPNEAIWAFITSEIDKALPDGSRKEKKASL